MPRALGAYHSSRAPEVEVLGWVVDDDGILCEAAFIEPVDATVPPAMKPSKLVGI